MPTFLIDAAPPRVLQWWTESCLPLPAPPPGRLLTGRPAYWLFAALTGHWSDQPPAEAQPDRARFARAHLERHAPTAPGYELARQVVEQWGQYLWPGLTPENDRLINLVDGQEFRPIVEVWSTRRWRG